MKQEGIAVVDFGGQYAHLIATKVRRLRVYAEIVQPEATLETFAQYKGIILSGSPALSAFDEDSAYDKRIYDLPIPILGFCFGHQEIAKHYGGRVEHTRREYGAATLRIQNQSPIFAGLAAEESVWMSHGDTVTQRPGSFAEIGVSFAGGIEHGNAAIANDVLRRYGFQFHPEVDDTVHGEEMLRNFCINICGCSQSWTMEHYIDEVSAKMRQQSQGKDVFLLASGGVDSTVCAVILGRALGPDRVHLLHIDNGLMRKDESRSVVEELRRQGLGNNLHFADASHQFLEALSGIADPEKKRRIIGDTFLEVFSGYVKKLDLTGCLLAQGTIYPDTIETGGTRRADVIKTHHNRVPAIEQMIERGLVIEPLAELYKTEVREVGARLGLPEEIIWRHPFPGPGLGIRLLCSNGEITDPISMNESQNALDQLLGGSDRKGIVLPIRSVGVKADLRCYEHPVLISGITDLDEAESLASQIFQQIPGVNRCVVNLSNSDATRPRLLRAMITHTRLKLLREADAIVTETLRKHGVSRKVWQCPTVLLPLELAGNGEEFVVIRPVLSERAMTARPALLSANILAEINDQIARLPGISGVGLDVTTKPPGTIEWE